MWKSELTKVAALAFSLTVTCFSAHSAEPARTMNLETRTYVLHFPTEFKYVRRQFHREAEYTSWNFESQGRKEEDLAILVQADQSTHETVREFLTEGGWTIDDAVFHSERVAELDITKDAEPKAWLFAKADCSDGYIGIIISGSKMTTLYERARNSILTDLLAGDFCFEK
jgi:hypothetical protein